MPEFIQGLELSRRFFCEVVRPILSERYPRLRYSAGLIGSGSEVLGYDDVVSSDHNWGPRLMLFLAEDERERLGAAISRRLRRVLPQNFWAIRPISRHRRRALMMWARSSCK